MLPIPLFHLSLFSSTLPRSSFYLLFFFLYVVLSFFFIVDVEASFLTLPLANIRQHGAFGEADRRRRPC